MLRGPQTPGELHQRTGRLHAFTGLEEIHETLDRLAERELAERLPRRPGQKEERYRHLLGEEEAVVRAEAPPPPPAPETVPAAPSGLEARVAALEAEVARLRESLERLETHTHD
jgi:uncharacterized protein YceH (UPF0502 family)